MGFTLQKLKLQGIKIPDVVVISQYSRAEGPGTLQLKLQKKSLSSIHTTTFFHNCKDLFNSFIYGQRFSQRFFLKNPCENLCSVRGP